MRLLVALAATAASIEPNAADVVLVRTGFMTSAGGRERALEQAKS